MKSDYTGRTSRLPSWRLILVVVALLLAACGKSSTLHPGYPVLTMTATNSGYKFASYIVEVNYITLTEQNGSVVYLLPVQQTLDLVQVSDMAELVSAYGVPYGTYVSASIQMTFVSADVILNGKAVGASFIGSDGALLTSTAIVLTFDPANPLVVTLNEANATNLNFDLLAFNTISTSTSGTNITATVTVQPYAVLRPTKVNNTPVRARGQFVTVQNGDSFIMNLRPFYDLTTGGLGAVYVTPTADAYWNINGTSYTGAAGQAALASQPVGIVVVAYGPVTGLAGPGIETQTNPTMSATEIYVGTAQENGLSYVQGNVSARSGNILTLQGVSAFLYNGTFLYYNGAIVTLGGSIPVSQDGTDNNSLTTQAISVGQKVYVSGTDTDPSTGDPLVDANNNLLVDATAGSVRLQHTRIWGSLLSAAPPTANLDVLSFGIWVPSDFNFTGTGTPAANPANYIVSTPTDFSTTQPGAVLAVDGGVSPFGAAPPDFLATAATAGANNEEMLVVDWPNGEVAPFLSASAAGYVVDLSKTTIGSIYNVFLGPVGYNIKTFPSSPLVTTVGADQSDLDLSVGSNALTTGMSLYSNPSTYYTSGVKAALNGTNKLYRLVAAGHYNSVSNTFVAQRIVMALHQ
jgi:hypothetical protein